MKIIIEKKNEEFIYKRVNTTVTFEVNSKPVRVYITEIWDDMEGSDYEINQSDLDSLTDLEHEAFGEEGIWDLVQMKDGEKLEVETEEDLPNEMNTRPIVD